VIFKLVDSAPSRSPQRQRLNDLIDNSPTLDSFIRQVNSGIRSQSKGASGLTHSGRESLTRLYEERIGETRKKETRTFVAPSKPKIQYYIETTKKGQLVIRSSASKGRFVSRKESGNVFVRRSVEEMRKKVYGKKRRS